MSTPRRFPPRNPFTGEGAAWRIAGAAMLVVTVAGQHPFEQFSRFRAKDVLSLVPNWRFFAPNPCMHDSHFLYRTVDADGSASPWHDAFATETRKPQHIVWFPTRRADKGMVDACADILPTLEFGGFEGAARTPGYRMITENLRVLIRSRGPVPEDVRGFQFALAKATGYDTRHRPSLLFVSPFVPLDPQAPGTPLTRTPAKTPAKV
ncbi:hypothetical protein OG920_03530 [Streptomyces europaeiscabiei]|uniref:hypothetical protein n=1 Tax=Streptomyces europaeiscabiei TaxID=146819 RepID=UPI0029AAAD77|nr:hypothetical protein [Streptomyces europaeiscabiei]MDX3635662.1 hypothetical protein [Streptomyces europaeiscabiei]MDX3653893.1 hypothetical protein [Streptomyces europaeiscabiei]